MAYIFSNAPGRASAIVDSNATPVIAQITDGGAYANMAAQSFLIKTGTNYQLMPTLRAMYYLYVFGEMPADIVINGICLASDCLPGVDVTGISGAISYYATHGLYYRSTPLSLQVGVSIFQTYLVGGEFELLNPETNLGRFTYQMKATPP